MPRRVHLVCNAHLDPVWLWERDEGIAAALSTFRCAADFCESFDGFVFNHNEAVLYEWVEEYEPALFARIRSLVAAGKWRVMGGWYLQPDCNMPSGESFVRQILEGRRYFQQKFGVEPTTAINFDPFGHDRGLVQILARSGYDSYLVCRPGAADLPLGGVDVRWVGYDGSSVILHRSDEWYNSPLGKAREKVERLLKERADDPLLILWGVGDHGGGASRADLSALADLIARCKASGEADISHSSCEDYFTDLSAARSAAAVGSAGAGAGAAAAASAGAALPTISTDLRPWGTGCYTSMVLVKQGHRAVEDALFGTEKLAAAAAMNGLMSWPEEELSAIRRNLLFLQFHDILPGSSIPEVEEAALAQIGASLDQASRIRSRAIFALASGLAPAKDGEIPILVYNPHPWTVETLVECEFQLADQNWEDSFTLPEVYAGDTLIPSQVEKERSNLNLDWRKRMVFLARLAPSGVSRFDCRLRSIPRRPVPGAAQAGSDIVLRGADTEVVIGARTGLIEKFLCRGKNLLRSGAGAVVALADDADPWGMTKRDYTRERGRFVLASPEETARIAAVGAGTLAPVRVIEDGPARTMVEAVFVLDRAVLVRRYSLEKGPAPNAAADAAVSGRGAASPSVGAAAPAATAAGLEIQDEILWDEPDRMLKLELPTALAQASYVGQGAFGRSSLPSDGSEAVAKRWVAAVGSVSSAGGADADAVLVYTDSGYGSDFSSGTIRLNLLRTAAYSAHPIKDRPLLSGDRVSPRMDRGVRHFSFRIECGPSAILDDADRRGLERGEKPRAVSFFPPGQGAAAKAGCVLEGPLVLSALKRAEADDGWIFRVYDAAGAGGSGTIKSPALGVGPFSVRCGPWEVRTYKLGDGGSFAEVGLME